MIFPEGITTNAKSIVDFKRGPFDIGAPVKIYYIKYEQGGFHPNANMLMMSDLYILLMLQPIQKVTLYELENCFYPKEFTDWKDFAEGVRELISKEFNVKKLPGNIKDQIAAEKELTPFNFKY